MHIRVAMAITSGCTPNFHTSERIPDDTPFYKTEKSVETSLKLEDCEDGMGEGTDIPVENPKSENTKASSFSRLRIDTDCDSDTDVEARVSPEFDHPLHSGGDFIEDEEMFARLSQTPYSERATFTSMLCDNE